MGEPDTMNYEYTTLMDMLHVSVSKHLLDDHFTLIWANDCYYDLIGYSKEEYEATYHNHCDDYYINDLLNIHDEEAFNKIGEVVSSCLQEGKNGYSLPTRMRCKNGEYIWVRMAGTFTQEYIDGCQVSYTVMTDINDIMRMRMEQSVTYENLPGFVAKYRISPQLDFTLLDANDRFVAFFGNGCYQNGEDSLFRQNYQRNLAIFETYRSQFLKGEPVHFNVRMNNQHGEDAWLQINAACIDRQGGDPVYLAVFIDVTEETELRALQARLEEQAAALRAAVQEAEEANRAKSDFLSRMSHDIRTPMNAIIGMTDIATSHLQEPDKIQNCLRKIALSSQHLLGLINDVLDMSKIESGNMALHIDTMSLPEVMENVVAIMQPQFQEKKQQFFIRLRCVQHEQLRCDAVRLRQVFLNILSNACKFTPEEGTITVDIQESASGQPEIALFTFTFTDTGLGMRPEFLEHLFDAFSREHDSRVDHIEGTGLGMAITQKIVELLGGTIDVKSEPRKGTTFCVRLPLPIENVPIVEEALPHLRVIVADDDTILCEHTLELLLSLGVEADYVTSGAEAVRKIAEAQQQEQAYDAVILDWKMPDQDGLQTTRQIREKRGDRLPILILSAYDWSEIEEQASAAGVTGFLSKPVFVSPLCRGLQKYVLGQAAPLTPQQQTRRWELNGRRFLLVEDNAINREVTVELLSEAGAAVEYACNGAEGLEKFRQSPEAYYDLILMDVQMPVMNGYDATKAIRKLPRKDAGTVPILAMTADAFAEDTILAKEYGMNGHLAKPLNEALMRKEISRYLRD